MVSFMVMYFLQIQMKVATIRVGILVKQHCELEWPKEQLEKQTIIHDLYFFQLRVPMLLEHQV